MSTVVLHLILESLDTTDTYTEYNANVVQVFLLKINFSVLYTLHGSNHSQLGITVKLASFLTINPIIDVQVFNLASELGLEKGCIEMSNRSSTALSSKKVIPGFLWIITYWSHSTETCYNNSL